MKGVTDFIFDNTNTCVFLDQSGARVIFRPMGKRAMALDLFVLVLHLRTVF